MKWYQIDEFELRELLHDRFMLAALRDGDVSSWDGYYDALDEFLLTYSQLGIDFEDFYDMADRAIMTQYKDKIAH